MEGVRTQHRRRFLVHVSVLLATLWLVIAGLSFMTVQEVAASSDERPPRCGTFPLTTWIWQGQSLGLYITFNNKRYYNGSSDTVSYCPGDQFTLSHSSWTGPPVFSQWIAAGGVLSSLTDNPTYFTPTGGPVQIEEILEMSGQRWAGLVGTSTVGHPISQVSVAWVLPNVVSWHGNGVKPGWPDCWPEVIAIWAGIGGIQGTRGLWQAGLLVEVYPGSLGCPSGVHFNTFYEDVGPACTNCHFTTDTGWADSHVHLGDTLGVYLYYSPGNNTGWGRVFDSTLLSSWWFTQSSLPYPPDETTEAFVAESPTLGSSIGSGDANQVLPMIGNPIEMFGASSDTWGPPDGFFDAPQTVNGVSQTFYPFGLDIYGHWWISIYG